MLEGMLKPPVLLTIAAVLAIGCSSPAAAPSTNAPATQAATASPAATLPDVPPATAPPATAAPAPTAGPDYTGDWGGAHLAGTIKYCGSTKSPYWAADIVSTAGDRGFLAYDIPAGSTAAVTAEVVTPFTVPEFTEAAKGTGQFVDGTPPHFIVVNGEGTYDIVLKVGKFCTGAGAQ